MFINRQVYSLGLSIEIDRVFVISSISIVDQTVKLDREIIV